MFYRRFLLDGLASRVSRNKVRILFGARQTGRTELLRRVVPAEHTVFFDLAETAVRRRFETDPAAFGESAAGTLPCLPAVTRLLMGNGASGSAELARCGAATRSADLRAARPAVSTAGSRAAQGALQPAHPGR